jgi:hypothetical protein
MKKYTSRLLMLLLIGCQSSTGTETAGSAPTATTQVLEQTEKTIHVFVALCDNESQGIVPVSELLGDGDDPANNLYWGAMYGTKTFLKRSEAWKLVRASKDLSEYVLERIVLKHRLSGAYLVADAYRGADIKKAVEDFLNAAAGQGPAVLNVGEAALRIHGKADLVAYVGHNGLMDFDVAPPEHQADSGPRAAIVLACKSKPYFQPLLSELGCTPVLLTTGLMAPEAYTLDAALQAWLGGEDAAGMRDSAAKAYDKYQKCGLGAAARLFFVQE